MNRYMFTEEGYRIDMFDPFNKEANRNHLIRAWITSYREEPPKEALRRLDEIMETLKSKDYGN